MGREQGIERRANHHRNESGVRRPGNGRNGERSRSSRYQRRERREVGQQQVRNSVRATNARAIFKRPRSSASQRPRLVP